MGLKHIENRASIPSPEKGRCAVSVSKKFCRGEYEYFLRWMHTHASSKVIQALPAWEDIQSWPGKIIGTIDYEVVEPKTSSAEILAECQVWDEGYRYWWHLSNPRLLDIPIPVRGTPGFWPLPLEISNHLTTK